MSPFIHLFGRDIPLYGLSWIIGIALAGSIAVLLCKRSAIERYDLIYSAVYSLIGGMIGSKLLFLIISLKQIVEQRIPLEAVLRGGFVFYGGLLGGALGLYIYVHSYKLPKLVFADLYALVLPLGHACGRIGCYFGGCCYGLPYSGCGCVVYTSSLGSTPLNTPLFPIQLVESVLLFLLFVALFVIYRRGALPGKVTTLYLALYALLRFILEWFRGDAERGSLLSLSTSQWISIGILLFLLIKKIYGKRHITAKTTG